MWRACPLPTLPTFRRFSRYTSDCSSQFMSEDGMLLRDMMTYWRYREACWISHYFQPNTPEEIPPYQDWIKDSQILTMRGMTVQCYLTCKSGSKKDLCHSQYYCSPRCIRHPRRPYLWLNTILTTDQSYPLVTDHPQTVLSIEIVGWLHVLIRVH
jgi:hypothetical protein